jgi:hypothetical protein
MLWLRRLVASSHRGSRGSIPSHFLWDLWWAKWRWVSLLVLQLSLVSIISPVIGAHLFIYPYIQLSPTLYYINITPMKYDIDDRLKKLNDFSI